MEKLRTFPQKINKFSYVKPRFFALKFVFLQENTKVNYFTSASSAILLHNIVEAHRKAFGITKLSKTVFKSIKNGNFLAKKQVFRLKSNVKSKVTVLVK